MSGVMRELALFAGAGGGILGGLLLGWRTVCAVELDAYARSVLLARQRDGALPRFPIWDDVKTFDGHPWRGHVDIVTGGFPCQDISCAGGGAGIEGERSGLWGEMARIIREVRPRFAFVENSPMLTSRGLGRVLRDLAEMGFDARWGVLGAVDAGAPHRRDRIWIVADAGGNPRRAQQIGKPRGGGSSVAGHDGISGDVAGSGVPGLEEWQGVGCDPCEEQPPAIGADWWASEPDVGRVANGVASRVDRLRAIGNGQVPAVVRLAWEVLR